MCPTHRKEYAMCCRKCFILVCQKCTVDSKCAPSSDDENTDDENTDDENTDDDDDDDVQEKGKKMVECKVVTHQNT